MWPTASTHRLRRGLPGYLILFAPHAFAPQRQLRPRDVPSPLVFLLISAHSTATPGIPISLPHSSLPVPTASSRLSLKFHSRRDKTPTSSLRPIIRTTLALRITAAAGVVGQCFSAGTVTFASSLLKRFTTRRPSSLTRRCCIRLAPIVQYSHCCLRRSLGRVSVPVWPVTLSGWLPVVAFGEPLPHQLADRPRDHP